MAHRPLNFPLLLLVPSLAMAQNNTDVSLFMKAAPDEQITECSAETGDLYKQLGHHGPAIENEFVGYRMFFDKKTAIDVYSKSRPGLELRTTGWYSTEEQQEQGWGADHYYVGDSVGLGGIRLWDGNEVIPLHPVSQRSGRVVKEGSVSFLEVRSEGVPYKGGEVDILLRITVFSGVRSAKVEAFALSNDEVQFVTGLNHREGETWRSGDDFLLSWAPTSGKVAVGRIEVGAAVMFNPDHFVDRLEEDAQVLLISRPSKVLEYWITSANSNEPLTNTYAAFEELVDSFDCPGCPTPH